MLENDYEREFYGDGKTPYKSKHFITKDATEVELTTDERKYFLSLFDLNGQKRTLAVLVVLSVFLFFASIILCVLTKTIKSLPFFAVSLAPSVMTVVAVIYKWVNLPTINKSVVKAYEFTVKGLRRQWYANRTVFNQELIRIKPEEGKDYMIYGNVNNSRYRCLLKLGTNWVKLSHSESNSVVRYGVNVDDKVRCVVLECKKWCYLIVC